MRAQALPAILLVALPLAATVACQQGVGTVYAVTLVNADSLRLAAAELRLGRSPAGSRLDAMRPGDSATIPVRVDADDHYVVTARWSDGAQLIDSTGYVTNGIAFSDTLELRRSGLTLRRRNKLATDH